MNQLRARGEGFARGVCRKPPPGRKVCRVRIAYMKGLEALAKTLEEFGHELVPLAAGTECDAVLTDGALPKVSAPPSGTLYLPIGGLSAEEVDKTLKRRLYTEPFGH
jgi:hypothetical protein